MDSDIEVDICILVQCFALEKIGGGHDISGPPPYILFIFSS